MNTARSWSQFFFLLAVLFFGFALVIFQLDDARENMKLVLRGEYLILKKLCSDDDTRSPHIEIGGML